MADTSLANHNIDDVHFATTILQRYTDGNGKMRKREGNGPENKEYKAKFT